MNLLVSFFEGDILGGISVVSVATTSAKRFKIFDSNTKQLTEDEDHGHHDRHRDHVHRFHRIYRLRRCALLECEELLRAHVRDHHDHVRQDGCFPYLQKKAFTNI